MPRIGATPAHHLRRVGGPGRRTGSPTATRVPDHARAARMATPEEDRELMGGRGGSGFPVNRSHKGRPMIVPIAERHEATALKQEQLRQAGLPGIQGAPEQNSGSSSGPR